MPHYILDARTATAHFPGIGRYVRNLAPALAAHLTGEERLSVLWNPADPTAWDPSPLATAGVTPIPAPVSPFALRQQWTLPRLLRGLRPRALYHSTYYLMPYRPSLPTVLTVYDLIPLLFPETVSWRARLFFRVATGLALRAADHVIAISRASRRDLLTHFPIHPTRVTAIPLAVEPRFHPRPPEEVQGLCARYGLPEDYLLYLGINKPHKNLVRLIRAYARLAGIRSAAGLATPPLVIAGAWDPRYPEPRQEVHARGLEDTVRFLGPVADADLPALYTGCTAFVFPSLYEGFGLPVLEAMACGAAVICSDRSSLPEVAGDAALLVDPTREEALTAAMDRVLREPGLAEALRARGRMRARSFTWERTAQETLAVYRDRVKRDT